MSPATETWKPPSNAHKNWSDSKQQQQKRIGVIAQRVRHLPSTQPTQIQFPADLLSTAYSTTNWPRNQTKLFQWKGNDGYNESVFVVRGIYPRAPTCEHHLYTEQNPSPWWVYFYLGRVWATPSSTQRSLLVVLGGPCEVPGIKSMLATCKVSIFYLSLFLLLSLHPHLKGPVLCT